MEAEFGKYYELNIDNYYFSVNLQRPIKFQDKLVVKCGSGFESLHFGRLVDLSISCPFGFDLDTNNEIEFDDEDIIAEYEKYQPEPILKQ